MDVYLRKIMQGSILFQNIDDNDYANLINYFSPKIKQFSKNEIILLTGDFVQNIGVVLKGTAHAFLEHVSGSQTLISNLMPMSVFGEILVSTRTHKSPVTIYAASDVTAAFIEYGKIYSMSSDSDSAQRLFLQNMLKTIGDKYFYLFDRIAVLREKTLRAKIMAYFFALSGNGAETKVIIPFSKTMLADYLLTNRSALSKELQKMKYDGLLTVRGREVELLFLYGSDNV